MNFLEEMKKKAKANKQTIVLPETADDRTLKAAEVVLAEEIANLILIGNEEKILKRGFKVEGATFIDPETYDLTNLIAQLVELRKSKGMTEEQATQLLKNDPLYLAVMLVKSDIAQGMVAGAINATGDVLRPSLQIIKTAPGCKIVSTFFVMVVPDCEFGLSGSLIFADSALVQKPSSEELASIAKSSADNFESIFGEEARVAMLSHSTMGSATHDMVTHVTEATRIAKEMYPDMKVDGELQLDAAIVPTVARLKAPDSPVAGQANVLIFPDIDSGNIGYKLVQRFAKADAYGPITQGLAKPINDLSRGCSTEDIIGVVAITAVQAQNQQ